MKSMKNYFKFISMCKALRERDDDSLMCATVKRLN